MRLLCQVVRIQLRIAVINVFTLASYKSSTASRCSGVSCAK
jgi:hypothetical protein